MSKEYGPEDIAHLEDRVAQLEKFSHDLLRAKWVMLLRDGTQIFGNTDITNAQRRAVLRALEGKPGPEDCDG